MMENVRINYINKKKCTVCELPENPAFFFCLCLLVVTPGNQNLNTTSPVPASHSLKHPVFGTGVQPNVLHLLISKGKVNGDEQFGSVSISILNGHVRKFSQCLCTFYLRKWFYNGVNRC